MTQRVILNPNNPEEMDMWKDVPVTDENGNPQVDSQGRLIYKRYVVRSGGGVSAETVTNMITAADQGNVKVTGNQTVAGNKSFSGTVTVTTPTKTVDGQTVTDTDDNTTKAANTKFVQAIKAKLAEDITNIAEKSNAITVSDTAPNVANMPVASGIMHPAQNIITENPDVSILALQQDMWAYSATKDYAVGSFVIYNNSIYQCIVANGPASTVANPSNVVYWSQIPTLADLETLVVPTGTVLLYAGSVLPQGYLGCQGAPFNPVTYEKLYTKIGTTYGGTAESPLLPDFRDRYPIGAGTNALGAYIAEQLPNITGDIYTADAGFDAGSSALTGDNAVNVYSTGTVRNTFNHLVFNAHNSNNIYTDSGKVYPASLALNFIIKT